MDDSKKGREREAGFISISATDDRDDTVRSKVGIIGKNGKRMAELLRIITATVSALLSQKKGEIREVVVANGDALRVCTWMAIG